MLIHNKDNIEFVTEFPCFMGHPVYKLIKDSSAYDFINWQSVSSLKNVSDTSTLAIGNIWRKPTFRIFKPHFYKVPISGQCNLLRYVYVDDFENVQLNIVDLQKIREEMLGWNLCTFYVHFLLIEQLYGSHCMFYKICNNLYKEKLLYRHVNIYQMYTMYKSIVNVTVHPVYCMYCIHCRKV